MLDLTRTRIDDSTNYPLYSGSPFVEEGAALSYDPSFFDGTQMNAGIMATPGAATKFVGIAYSYFTIPTTDTNIEQWTIPATTPFTINLVNTPASGYGILVKDTAGNTYASADAAASGKYSISGNTLTFDSSAAGLTVFVQYRWNITVQQAEFRYGDGVAGRSVPSDTTGTMSVIRRGVVSTSCFNTAVDYSTMPTLYLGANGMIDPTNTNGPVIPGAYVQVPPSVDQPTLTFYFAA